MERELHLSGLAVDGEELDLEKYQRVVLSAQLLRGMWNRYAGQNSPRR